MCCACDDVSLRAGEHAPLLRAAPASHNCWTSTDRATIPSTPLSPLLLPIVLPFHITILKTCHGRRRWGCDLRFLHCSFVTSIRYDINNIWCNVFMKRNSRYSPQKSVTGPLYDYKLYIIIVYESDSFITIICAENISELTKNNLSKLV